MVYSFVIYFFLEHKKLHCALLLSILCTSISLCQQTVDDIQLQFFSSGSHDEQWLEDLHTLDNINKNKLDSLQLWAYFMKKSNLTAYLVASGYSTHSMEDGARMVDSAMIIDALQTCALICQFQKAKPKMIKSGYINADSVTFWLDLFSDGYIENISNRCNVEVNYVCQSDSSNLFGTQETEKKYGKHSLIFKEVYHRDQRQERQEQTPDWIIQDSLDNQNRQLIDELIRQDVSMHELVDYDLKVISLVLHHSNDWAWTKKWIDLLLSLKLSHPDRRISFLGLAIDRHLNLNNGGSCEGKQCDEIKAYKQYLVDKYPAYLCEAYNIRVD